MRLLSLLFLSEWGANTFEVRDRTAFGDGRGLPRGESALLSSPEASQECMVLDVLFLDALLPTSFSLANRLVESVVLALFPDIDAILLAFAEALSSLESLYCLSSLSPDLLFCLVLVPL